ncbi:HNH endonuclease [Bradyrhizobium daqingense]|uniref:HNH endonuclease n=1 Tax=Bradyrhizobium daqingense TaxID=993502 RepID=UPI0011AAB18E|nr:HNH endonuclease [Bradyrhizobium daqingense]UFS87178.1 HNH endonuclease [Bradyrhizobium daqingense]
MTDHRSPEAKQWRKLYSTAQWRATRAAQLAMQPLCEWCLEQGVVEPATEVHHDGPHKGDIGRFFSGPFVSTCKACHASRGQREDLGQAVVTFGADGWPVDG